MKPVPLLDLGVPPRLGAHGDGAGVHFALYAGHAKRVELCLYDASGRQQRARLTLPGHGDGVWHGYLPGAAPGLLYGYRVYGSYAPEKGHRHNPYKLLLDPYACQLVGALRESDALYGYRIGHAAADLGFDRRDSAAWVPKCRVIDDAFDWQGDRPPRTPWSDTVIYELHVRGYTRQHPSVPEHLRGTYLGLIEPAVIAYLKRLGITAVELLPVHAHAPDRRLAQLGFNNYWGYNTLGFFAPHAAYAVNDPVGEFKAMVRALHGAGIEVILDVVYNHTVEGSEQGPTLSWRGIDNAAYYRARADAPRHCVDYTGTGNTLNLEHPVTLRLVLDSLRYWVTEMHVDGFRFDLASALAREGGVFTPHAAFLKAIYQDPILSQVKLIAEPWDVGYDGYQIGQFPPPWREWNGAYRDTARAVWCGDGGLAGVFATRLTGSSDMYRGRGPMAGINFVTCHDGFTLADLVAYNEKHNELNGEDNHDGENHNRSWNCGAEGPTRDPAIVALRARQRRNLLATLLLSQGVPMLLAGDEFGRSQGGNNNAYCQDNDISWIDWTLVQEEEACVEFVVRLLRLRRECSVLRRRDFFHGARTGDMPHKDITWLTLSGEEMHTTDWEAPGPVRLALWIAAEPALYIAVNSAPEAGECRLPLLDKGVWRRVLDTAAESQTRPAIATTRHRLTERSLQVWQQDNSASLDDIPHAAAPG